MINQTITLYVDGACRGNPGLGGWGVYIIMPNGKEQELFGGEVNTTNNRMELTAALEGIKATQVHDVLTIWTDSNYVKQGMTEWLVGWKKKNWRKADGKPVLNADLWQQLDVICRNRQIDWQWIKGHAGHAGNERADYLANCGADRIASQINQSKSIDAPESSLVNKPLQQQQVQPQRLPEDDWLLSDPLGLDMTVHESDDYFNPENTTEEWIDPVNIKSNAEKQHKEQQLEAQNLKIAVQRTYAKNEPKDRTHYKVSGKRQLILDTETTGFSFADGDRIIEIGAIEMVDRKLTGSSFHVYLNPQRLVGDSVNVHGLTDEFLQDKLLFNQIANELNDYLQHAEIVAHNATFDMNFLEGEFLKAGFPSLKSRAKVVDTLALAKRKHPGQKNSLDALVKRYEIKQRDRTFHGALLDAEILADVYLFMTGGQVALEIGHEQEDSGGLSQHRQFKQARQLPVIRASVQESQTHQQWLQDYADKHGQIALWQTVFK